MVHVVAGSSTHPSWQGTRSWNMASSQTYQEDGSVGFAREMSACTYQQAFACKWQAHQQEQGEEARQLLTDAAASDRTEAPEAPMLALLCLLLRDHSPIAGHGRKMRVMQGPHKRRPVRQSQSPHKRHRASHNIRAAQPAHLLLLHQLTRLSQQSFKFQKLVSPYKRQQLRLPERAIRSTLSVRCRHGTRLGMTRLRRPSGTESGDVSLQHLSARFVDHKMLELHSRRQKW